MGVYPDGGRSIWLLGMLITFKAVSEETGGEYSVFEQTVPPQAGVPPHIHHQESFKNLGTTPARFLAIVTPGGLHEKYLSESGQPAESETLPPPPEGPPDLERLRQIVRRYHTEMLPNLGP